MVKIRHRLVLVVGDNPDEIIKKYSCSTKKKKHLLLKYNDIEKHRQGKLKDLAKVLRDKLVIDDDNLYDTLKDHYQKIKNMSKMQYLYAVCGDCIYDETTLNAYSMTNDEGYFKNERCQQKRLKQTGEEGDFSDPFPLLDGTISYSAHVNEIDWGKIHRNEKKIQTNSRVWDLMVNDEEPQNEQEEYIKEEMIDHVQYFDNFKDKESYIKHSTSLWYWGVATENYYREVDYRTSDMEWIVNFYDKYIEPLKKDNPLLTIYEVCAV